ncbi:MAG: hypothetical protein M1837_000742 [Sclerophora amabilis]|nr:MAG: hypothetical protein M1837_000742 [Sclerophora amabilis]
MLTATRLQAATYLLCVCLFSISFLVFLNSSVSFVITDLIGIKDGVGDLVGTLGFVDEIVALIACPLWGVFSDRVGVRTVCVLGYAIVGVALFLFVQAKNVYPQLLLARLFFSLGGAATSTMVTAILPAMTASAPTKLKVPKQPQAHHTTPPPPAVACHSTSPSLSSQLTITPARMAQPSKTQAATQAPPKENRSPSRLAGIVGMFTGGGALIALLVFLPLPTRFSGLSGVSPGQAVADSYYVVGIIALIISACCCLGFRNLRGEEGKGLRALWGKKDGVAKVEGGGSGQSQSITQATYWRSLKDSILLGFGDAHIGLSYLGGFVARATSVGISLFIPLFVNAYFISSGLCQNDPSNGTTEMKEECRRAYVLASKLTGVSQLVALLCAPLFGYLSDRYRRFNLPLLSASLTGVVAYVAFGLVRSPEPSAAEGGSPFIFVLVALIGINQIGAIVCSLGLLGRGVLADEEREDAVYNNETSTPQSRGGSGDGGTVTGAVDAANDTYSAPEECIPETEEDEHSSLLPQQSHATTTMGTPTRSSSTSSSHSPSASPSRTHLKGSIAGVYSLTGAAGILLLTKLGGYLFDAVTPGAPFFMLATFNGVLFVAGIAAGVREETRRRRMKQRRRGDE